MEVDRIAAPDFRPARESGAKKRVVDLLKAVLRDISFSKTYKSYGAYFVVRARCSVRDSCRIHEGAGSCAYAGKAKFEDLKAYDSHPSRLRNSIIRRKYYTDRPNLVAMERGKARIEEFSRNLVAGKNSFGEKAGSEPNILLGISPNSQRMRGIAYRKVRWRISIQAQLHTSADRVYRKVVCEKLRRPKNIEANAPDSVSEITRQ